MGLTRKQRRQAQTTASESLPDLISSDIPLVQPDRSGPKGKTLYDLAAEREAELVAQADAINAARRTKSSSTTQALSSPTTKQANPSDASKPTDKQNQEQEQDARDAADVERVLTSITYATTLAMLHFTLAVLVHHQYAQKLVPLSVHAWGSVWPLSPILVTLVYLAHTPTAKRWPWVRHAVFAAVSIACGCRLVRMGNEDAYLAVMRGAPPMGVVWVWSVVEMDVRWGAASLGVVAAWATWKGYGFW